MQGGYSQSSWGLNRNFEGHLDRLFAQEQLCHSYRKLLMILYIWVLNISKDGDSLDSLILVPLLDKSHDEKKIKSDTDWFRCFAFILNMIWI